MIQEDLLQRITESYGCAVTPGMYERIRRWEDWWRGEVDGFHTYLESAAFGNPVRRRMYGLRMAKKVCEDWAALLLNDHTDVELENPAAEGWLEKVLAEQQCFSLAGLAVNGRDMMALGLNGKEIGDMLEYLLGEVVEEQLPNEKEALLQSLITAP